ncbi:MAG: hypothetical protein KKH88_02110 [Nanoarchaeota archaeon]|nr:hypothetical protein [Nanoarchaeota archaeon]
MQKIKIELVGETDRERMVELVQKLEKLNASETVKDAILVKFVDEIAYRK